MNYIKYSLILALLLFSACDDEFLDKYPLDSVTHETYWETENQLRAALYPCYEGLDYELLMYPNVFGGDVVWGTLTVAWPKSPEEGTLLWTDFLLPAFGLGFMHRSLPVITSWTTMTRQMWIRTPKMSMLQKLRSSVRCSIFG
ncbi:hypothetical protein [Echinicola soli]|uniref:hypothetical protein n=1 Tax=Echinicola soli TaxID=2591634 RepID=UPI001E3C02DA|nr:hypothetical protein [Echinicola soli]